MNIRNNLEPASFEWEVQVEKKSWVNQFASVVKRSQTMAWEDSLLRPRLVLSELRKVLQEENLNESFVHDFLQMNNFNEKRRKVYTKWF